MAIKLKILHVTKKYPPFVGGIETVCKDLCNSLIDDYEQKVLCFNTAKNRIEENYQGIDVIRVGVNFTLASQPISFSYKKELYKVMKEYNPDIIHFDYPNPLASHYLLKAMKKYHFKGKFQLFWHMDIVKQKFIEPFFKKEILKMIDLADQIIITSPNYLSNTSYLPKYADKNKVVILPLRVGDDRLMISDASIKMSHIIRKENKDKFIGFFFGRHVPYKGIEYLIEANKYLDQDKYLFYIGGEGQLTPSLVEKAKDMKNIIFTGRLTSDDINGYLLASDIFLFPSITRNEAFGISLAEGLWFKKPAVTFTIVGSGVNYVSINNETGLEVENRNSKAYAEAIERLNNDKELYNRLSINAYKRSHELFSKEHFNKLTKDIYLKLEKGS